MESLFAHTYLLLFGKLAVGGVISLAVPSFGQMERGFYKSSAAVFLGCAYLITLGDAYLYFGPTQTPPLTAFALGLWGAFCLLFSIYFAALFGKSGNARARSYPATLFLGCAALAVTAAGARPEGTSLLLALPFVASSLAGAAIAGAAATGMLLGHWYLIDTGLELGPLRRMNAFYGVVLRIEIAVVLAGALALWLWPGSPLVEGFEVLASSRFAWLSLGRIATWGLALLLMGLITRTLAIPQTMAATGLFYIASLVVAVGQIASHWLLFRTGVPL